MQEAKEQAGRGVSGLYTLAQVNALSSAVLIAEELAQHEERETS